MAQATPRGIAATIGVFGSASTWVFNVMRELSIAAYGAEHVHAFFSNDVAPVLADPRAHDRHLIWKLHHPDAAWPDLAARTGARLILTLRDPRDAVLSMMQRFGASFDPACAAVLQALRAVAENTARPHLALRYETRFFDDMRTVETVARHLGLTIAAADQMRIFEAYATERVRRFGLELDTLPPDRIETVGTATRFDLVTHIHQRHIGDQRVGKWREDTSQDHRRLLQERFGPVLQAFGYQ